jgi:hypothetical protein
MRLTASSILAAIGFTVSRILQYMSWDSLTAMRFTCSSIPAAFSLTSSCILCCHETLLQLLHQLLSSDSLPAASCAAMRLSYSCIFRCHEPHFQLHPLLPYMRLRYSCIMTVTWESLKVVSWLYHETPLKAGILAAMMSVYNKMSNRTEIFRQPPSHSEKNRVGKILVEQV